MKREMLKHLIFRNGGSNNQEIGKLTWQVQNGSGAVSSLAFLFMLFIWRNWKAPAAGEVAEERQPLLDNQEVVIVVTSPQLPEALHPQLPEALQPQQAGDNQQQVAKRASTAPPTPERVVTHRRASSF